MVALSLSACTGVGGTSTQKGQGDTGDPSVAKPVSSTPGESTEEGDPLIEPEYAAPSDYDEDDPDVVETLYGVPSDIDEDDDPSTDVVEEEQSETSGTISVLYGPPAVISGSDK